MPPSRDVPVDLLLAESRWLVRLARALVRQDADVDDVVQQTWLQALATPPKRAQRLRSWLGAIARNVVRGRVRSAERRERRERSVALPPAPASPEQAVERVELRRRVAEAVLALAEPYRSTIVMRFFDAMTAGEIRS